MSELASPAQLRASFLRWALVLVPAVELLGFLSGQLGDTATSPWFQDLEKPSLFPPPAVFSVVWSILFAMIAIALAVLITARGAKLRGVAIGAWIVTFLLILCWSPLFFAAHQITKALYLLILIDVVALVATVLAFRVRPIAGALMVPFLGWVLFATALNWQFLAANPAADGASGSTISVDLQ